MALPTIPPHWKTQNTSGATPKYNCVAWALGDPRFRWWPMDEASSLTTSGYYWPDDVPRENTIAAFDFLFRKFGFERCADDSIEEGYEKVALYAEGDEPTHAAWQTVDGVWSSKVGTQGEDCLHETPQDMNSYAYGVVHSFYRRPRQRWLRPIDPMDLNLDPTVPLGEVTVEGLTVRRRR